MPPKRKSRSQGGDGDEPEIKKKGSVTRDDVTSGQQTPPVVRKKQSMKRQDTSDISDVKKRASLTKAPTFDIHEILKITEPPKESWLFELLRDDEWKEKLCGIFHGELFQNLEKKLKAQYDEETVFPPEDLIFNAFNLTPFDKVKIVILGQDPYHDDNQAQGLSFSVPKGVNVPRSLKNIYKELSADLDGFRAPDHGCLGAWAERGVLLLNATLTVVAHKPNSHSKLGWQDFTDKVIRLLSEVGPPLVFILWGGFAHKKESLIDATRHRVIKTAHPSPLSLSKFMGCKCFSKANDALRELGREPMDWSLP